MHVHAYRPGAEPAISGFFRKVFESSEGPDEGHLIGSLATDILRMTEACDFHCGVITDDNQIIASAFYSRLTYPSSRNTFVIGPVAVRTNLHRKGFGQKLLNLGIANK